MSRSLMVRVVSGAVAIVVAAALVFIAVTRVEDNGKPEEATSPAPSATARAIVTTPASTAAPAVRQRGIEGDSDLWRVVDSFCDERALVFPWRFMQMVPDEDVLARAASESPPPPSAANEVP